MKLKTTVILLIVAAIGISYVSFTKSSFRQEDMGKDFKKGDT